MKQKKSNFMASSPVVKVLSENEKARVTELISKPDDVAKMHSHPDHVVYVLKGGKASLTSKGKTQEIELKTGTATIFDATEHEMKNTGNTTLDLIIVEIKK